MTAIADILTSAGIQPAVIDVPLREIQTTRVVDELGIIEEQRTALSKRANALKGVLKERAKETGQRRFNGTRFFVALIEKTRNTLDKKAVVNKLGQAWVDDNTKSTSYDELQVSPIRPE